MAYKTGYDAIHMYLSDVTSRLVAKTGIPSDRYHFGKIIMQCFQNEPDLVSQIDGSKDISETAGSVLNRTIRCAIALKKLGLGKGDVMVLTGLNHLDLCIPHYAALYLGVMVAGIDPTFGVNELRDAFIITKPKIVFCDGNKTKIIENALKGAELKTNVIVFGESNGYKTLSEFVLNIDDNAVKEFRPTDFDPEDTPAYLTSTSGTTGFPKAAILTHKNLFIGISYIWLFVGSKFPTPTNLILNVSPIQWLTAGFVNLFSPILKVTRLQSSEMMNPKLFAHLINKYKPTSIMTNPLTFQNVLAINEKCDFTCFESILLGGSAVAPELIEKLKKLAKTEHVYTVYGMSEVSGIVFIHDFPAIKGSSGHTAGHLEYRLVDPDTKEDIISKANTPGELWLRGPSTFKGYYNDPEMTATSLTEDGWFMTGDILYRDNYWHFYFLDRLKSLLKYKNYQIDGVKDISETAGSVLNRTIRCAIALQKLGLEKGDVMVLTGLNHIDLCIPHYAALYLGVMVAGTDPTFGVNELRDVFTITKPKIIFCEGNKSNVIENALKCAELEVQIVVFSEGGDYKTLSELIRDIDDSAVKEFQPTDFDPEETPAYLTSTSGTTGFPKAATLTHKNLFIGLSYTWLLFGSQFPTPTNLIFTVSPVQWVSAGFVFLFSPIMKVPRLQSSKMMNPKLFVDLVNKYKPTSILASPLTFANVLALNEKCDFTCFTSILIGGSVVAPELVDELKKRTQIERVYPIYGLSEVSGMVFIHDLPTIKGSSGHTAGHLEFRLVDPDTKKDVTSKANTPGELWLRGPSVFKGYYNNPEMTAKTLTEDGWVMTGDMFYRDDYWHFYFIDRLKSLLKYKNFQVSPAEVETVIKKHPGVLHVCVTGIPDKNCGDLVVACVIPKSGSSPSAQEIKDIVKESLSDSKQLRGGVIFFKEFPLTNNSKINRKKLQEIVLTMDRE